MTIVQFEELKRQQLQNRSFNVKIIKDLFPGVEKLEISYRLYHGSAFGVRHEEHKRVLSSNSPTDFIIECLNRECSSVGFDLRAEVYSMVRGHQTERSGRMECEGQEAPDHPEQSCNGTLEYTIHIEYK